MPYGDGTGPYGTGPVGMRRGRCFPSTGVTWPVWRGVRSHVSPEEEREYLNDQKKEIETMLKEVTNRLHELEDK